MRKSVALAAAFLVVLVLYPAVGAATPVATVRVVVGFEAGSDYGRAKAFVELFGVVESEIREIKAVVLSLPEKAVEHLKGLPFVRYVEVDRVVEVVGKPSSPPGSSKPKVSLVDYTSNVTAPVGETAEIRFTLKNVGKVDVYVVVELRNEKGSTVASVRLAVPVGTSVAGSLVFSMPSTAGTYTWSLVVVDAGDSKNVYASATVTVNAVSSPTQPPPSDPPSSGTPTYTDTIRWNIEMINATKVWSLSTIYGEASYGYHPVVQVAILDTGIDYTHKDLAGAVVWCTVSLNSTKVFYRGSDLTNCADPNGHGTHVAGIVAARLNNWGIAGVAPRVVLYAVRVLNEKGTGYASDIARGIVEAVKGPDGSVGTEDDADVISMSFGGSSSSVVYDAVRYAYSNGVVLVAAAGNSGSSSPLCPACYPEVVAVGAVDRYYQVASWSNRNPDIVAPGSGILSTWPGGSLVTASGTSMACPHVSATVALVQALRLAAVKQKMTPAQIMDLIRSTAVDLGAPGYDLESGYGLIDAYAAVTRALNLS